MKNFAKLAVLFSFSFLIIFLLAACLRFLSLRVEWAKILPAKPETTLTLLISAAHWALSLSLFSTILFSLTYAARRNYFAIMTIATLMILSFIFCFGISSALNNWMSVPPSVTAGIPLGEKGLILSNSLNRNETAVILLNGSEEPLGPRVTTIPQQAMVFHQAAGGNFDLPPVPFGDDTPWFLKSLSIDIRLNAGIFQRKLTEGFIPFLFYAGSIIFLLCSLGYAMKFSVWPLANLFLGVLAFRGILALTTFINNPETLDIMGSFLKNMIPASYVVPLGFFTFGSLIHLYSFLIFVIKRKPADEY